MGVHRRPASGGRLAPAGGPPAHPAPVSRAAGRGETAPDDPAAAVLEAQSTRAAYVLIAELPRAQAEVLALRILGGLEVAEVAQILGNARGRSER
jgi:DNA-directed RNA polymerase specialized sigma24 family protein